jgi:DNA-binding transcriptional LysR family regulator
VRREEWRFKNAQGEEYSVTPTGQLRGTSIEGILPSVLAGMLLADLPEFNSFQYIHDGRLEPILTDWQMQDGGLYFVTPTTRARPAKVSALADFFISRLSGAEWRSPTIEAKAWKERPSTS